MPMDAQNRQNTTQFSSSIHFIPFGQFDDS